MNNTPANAVHWFEIPTADFSKSIPFYNQVLGITLEATEFGPAQIAVFPYARPGVGGCLTQQEGLTPSSAGTIVYLPTKQLDEAIARVVPAGGKVMVPKTPVGPNMGFFAKIRDLEGNVVGIFGLE
jgi:predicted enzyme related to lactoylglutathione lyase